MICWRLLIVFDSIFLKEFDMSSNRVRISFEERRSAAEVAIVRFLSFVAVVLAVAVILTAIWVAG